MKRLMLAAALAAVVSSSTGCCLLDRLFYNQRGYPLGQCTGPGCYQGRLCAACGGAGCPDCMADPSGGHGRRGCLRGGRGYSATRNMSRYSGPPTGTVAYPYYTNRGPRDFFLDDPPSIGP